MEFTFKCKLGHRIMTMANKVTCAGPITDYCNDNKAYTEYYLPLENEDGEEIKEEDLINWIEFINKTGLNILYCGVIYKKDIMEEFYLCIIHNELIRPNFPHLVDSNSGIETLNLMSVQALRFIEYYPEIVEYSYLIYKELEDAFLSIQIAHYKYMVYKNENISSDYSWIESSYEPLFKSNEEFNKISNFNYYGINTLFWSKLKNCYTDYDYKVYINTLTDNYKTIHKLLFGWTEYHWNKPDKKVIDYLNNNEFKNFIKYFEK